MKIGIVSDLHCNARGLMRALEIIGDIDELLRLDDSIYDFRFSNEVVRALRQRGACVILCDHEEGFFAPAGVQVRGRPEIDRALLGWLTTRSCRRQLACGGKCLLMVHSTPWKLRGAHPVYELPMAIPVAKTSKPPTMTWSAADTKGVSI
ncbi:MAG: metallophosphoesterase family protein [Stellaceae bacterium]